MKTIDIAKPINRKHPLARNLALWWKPVPYGVGGPRVRDLCGRTHGPLVGAAKWQGCDGFFGVKAIVGADSVSVSTPAYLKVSSWPVSVGCTFFLLGAPDAYGGLFGVSYSNDGASPYLAYAIGWDGSRALTTYMNAAGSFHNSAMASNYSQYVGKLTRALLVISTTRVRLYVNGVPVVTDSTSYAGPVYGAGTNSLLQIGDTRDNRGPNMVFLDGAIWTGRALTDADARLDYAISCRRDQ